jgi:hypothetical protein
LGEAGRPSRFCLVVDNDFRDALPSPAMPIGSIRPDANIFERCICRETTPRNCLTEIG